LYSLPKRAKKDKLDILHVQYITPPYLSKNIKLITTIHDISFARFPEFINKKDLFLLRLLIKKSLKRADKIIAISKFTRDEIADVYNISKNKVAVIYNGGVAEEFNENITEQNVLKFRVKYDIIKPYLLNLGTLQPRKNITFLIKSFVALKIKYANNNNVKELALVIRGKRGGHNYDKGIDKILKVIKGKYPNIHKQIKFVGYISNEETPLIFKGATAFCFTSMYEGFGLPLLESMAVETPVIANGSSCFPEIINDAGMIYKTGDSNSWVNRVRELISNKELQKELASKGRERVEFFSWSKSARQTVELYELLKH
jgi:glycosyltransferase involved in cell wall biosynthesis